MDVKLLDCTLRDGGYANSWEFGRDVIPAIIRGLVEARVDVIECGYLTEKFRGGPDKARYNSFSAFEAVVDQICLMPGQRFALMVNCGEVDVGCIPLATANAPVVRFAFHKRDMKVALKALTMLKNFGYCVYAQPMAIHSYAEEEFGQLARAIGGIGVDAFYLVDSFGVLDGKTFDLYMQQADTLLPREMMIGYHGHNNLQQAADNARRFVESGLDREILVDGSVFGIGRGAGNLNSELFSKYLNDDHAGNYDVEKFLMIYDRYLQPIYQQSPWGYSLPYYLSACHRCHPNYAAYFAKKGMLGVHDMHKLLARITLADRSSFSNEKAADYYYEYLDERRAGEGNL